MSDRELRAELRADYAAAPLHHAEDAALISRLCRIAYEHNTAVIIPGVDGPRDPIDFLANDEFNFLRDIDDAVASDRLDLAADIIRNLWPLYERLSQLANQQSEPWAELLEVVREASDAQPDALARGIILILLARNERVHNDWPRARALAEEAVEWCIARAQGDQRVLELLVEAYEALGEVCRSQRHLDDAICHFDNGLLWVQLVEDDGVKRGLESRLRDRRGYAYLLLGKANLALVDLVRSIRLHAKPSLNPAELGRTYNNIGKTFAALQRPDIARRYFSRSYAIKGQGQRHDERGQAVCLHEIGLLYRADDDYARAIKYLEKSHLVKQMIDDQHGMGLSLKELGHTYDTLGDETSAKQKFVQASIKLTRDSPEERQVLDRLREGPPKAAELTVEITTPQRRSKKRSIASSLSSSDEFLLDD